MLEQIKKRLGENYQEGTDSIIQDIIDDITPIACDASNRNKNDEKIIPYVKKAVISEYLQRGAEGLLSRSEGGISSSFNDIEKKLRTDIVTIRRMP